MLDVDGVLTTGQFFYTDEGKVMKVFGPDDNDALRFISQFLDVRFITADRIGYPISKKRIVDDMGFSLDLVSSQDRAQWISNLYNPDLVVYMGDGFYDSFVMRTVGYSIAPLNADPRARRAASFVTRAKGGNRAVAEACIHLKNRFFRNISPLSSKSKV